MNIREDIMNLSGLEVLSEAKDSGKGNFYGIPGIKFIWHGEWADPEVEYKRRKFNYYDVEDTLYGYYKEEGGKPDDDKAFASYVKKNRNRVYELLDDMMD